MSSFGYRETRALVIAEISQQIKRSEAGEDEVLNIPIVLGGVGLGKTSLARYVAAQLGLPLVKINCGECGDPSEFGMPVPFRIVQDANNETYMPWVLNRALHIACMEPVVLFFDDIDKVTQLVEGSLLSLFGERTVRDRKLHKDTVIMAAGNRTGDDVLARQLSESLRTRGTIINMEPRLADFAAYGQENPEKVHPTVLGFLQYRPNLLHKHDPDADRFPTPRGWTEVSAYLYSYKADHDLLENKRSSAWKVAVALKCGDAASNDFYAWWTICSKIDMKKLLKTGELDHTLDDAADKRIIDYAAIFALAQELNHNGAKKEHVGLVVYLEKIHPEHRVALLTQLTTKTRRSVAKVLPKTSSMLLSDIVSLGE